MQAQLFAIGACDCGATSDDRISLPFRDDFRITLCLSALAPIRTSQFQMCGKSPGIEILRMAGAEAVQARAHEMMKF